MIQSKPAPKTPGREDGPGPKGGNRAPRELSLPPLVSIPLAGVLMALGALAFSDLRRIPPPEATWILLIFCAGGVAANVHLATAIGTAQKYARWRGKDPARETHRKWRLLSGLTLAAVLAEMLYGIYVYTAQHPYGRVLFGVFIIGLGLFALGLALTGRGKPGNVLGRGKAENTPSRPVPPCRAFPLGIFFGIGGSFLIFCGAWALWMEPTAVLERAQGGEARWQYEAAGLYFHGDGLPEDPEKAFTLYLAAARQGYGKAYFHVGRMYREGIGTAKHPAEAARWSRKAAEEAGNPGAWNNVGLAYAYGEGLERDPVEAVKCFRRAAEGGNADGRYNLGLVYESGFGVAADEELALYWYEQAGGHREAREKAGALKARGVRPKKPEAAAMNGESAPRRKRGHLARFPSFPAGGMPALPAMERLSSGAAAR
jgi:hypothetical protein